MKKAQVDFDDIFALLLWVMIIILFLVILSIGGCNKGFSRASIQSERENTMDATRSLLNYLNSNVEYEKRNMTISEMISEFYIIQDTSKKDSVQKFLTQKTKDMLESKTCWTIIVLANPRIEVKSDKCGEIGALQVMASKVRVAAKIPKGMESLEVEYQEYVFREKEVGGKH